MNDTTTPRTDAESEGNYFSDSPRVNALIIELRKPSNADRTDMISLARDLERELTEAKAEVERLQKELDAWDYGTRAKREQEARKKSEANLRRAVEIAEEIRRWTILSDNREDMEKLRDELDELKANLNPETNEPHRHDIQPKS